MVDTCFFIVTVMQMCLKGIWCGTSYRLKRFIGEKYRLALNKASPWSILSLKLERLMISVVDKKRLSIGFITKAQF